MAKVKTVRSKIITNQRLTTVDHNPVQYSIRLPREDWEWIQENVDGNVNFVIAHMFRRVKKMYAIHLAQTDKNVVIRELDDEPTLNDLFTNSDL